MIKQALKYSGVIIIVDQLESLLTYLHIFTPNQEGLAYQVH